jgi:hypothetical protein
MNTNTAYVLRVLIQISICIIVGIALINIKKPEDPSDYQLTRQATPEEKHRIAVQVYSIAVVSLNHQRSYSHKMLVDMVDVLAYEYTRMCRDQIIKKCIEWLNYHDSISYDGSHIVSTSFIHNDIFKKYIKSA